MIGNQSDFPTPEAVAAFQRDSEALGLICDANGWYVTPEWASKFQSHLNALLPLASEGLVSAQYAIAGIYMLGYIYSSESEAIAHAEQDQLHACEWLERAAASGHLGAIDNLLSIGASNEAKRLRAIFNENRSQFEGTPPPLDGWLRDMKKLYELAYGSRS